MLLSLWLAVSSLSLHRISHSSPRCMWRLAAHKDTITATPAATDYWSTVASTYRFMPSRPWMSYTDIGMSRSPAINCIFTVHHRAAHFNDRIHAQSDLCVYPRDERIELHFMGGTRIFWVRGQRGSIKAEGIWRGEGQTKIIVIGLSSEED